MMGASRRRPGRKPVGWLDSGAVEAYLALDFASAAGLAGALLALALFFSVAFFFLAVSRASPIVHSFTRNLRRALMEMICRHPQPR